LWHSAGDMAASVRTLQDLAAHARTPGPHPAGRVSTMAARLVGSEILRISGEIRALVAAGQPICDLTVGDFDPRHFPIPDLLREGIREALARGETNYPPSSGLQALRQAVQRLYARDLGLEYPLESILVASGSRPAIYGTFRTVCDPGDRVVFPVPSWNNNHYAHLVGAAGVPVAWGPATRFLPTRESVERLLPGARLLCLNSPLNPTGTAFDRDTLLELCEAVLRENQAREARGGERPLYLLYDQVYWMLCFGGTSHVTPPELVPEMARYTIFVDGISKAFAATGVRVGWAVGPTDVIGRMSAIFGHVGAWAPRAEQVGAAQLLDDPAAIREYQVGFRRRIQSRLDRLHRGLQALKSHALPVETIPPMGAMYLTAQLHPFGRRTPDGAVLRTNDDVRRYLLTAAHLAVVPFQAFGATEDDGWFRLSVGAVSEDDLQEALVRLEDALRRLA
jgi:aspartate aminotransferase